MSNVKIVSDGTTQGTLVSVDESFTDGITKIEIEPLNINGFVTAKLTIEKLN